MNPCRHAEHRQRLSLHRQALGPLVALLFLAAAAPGWADPAPTTAPTQPSGGAGRGPFTLEEDLGVMHNPQAVTTVVSAKGCHVAWVAADRPVETAPAADPDIAPSGAGVIPGARTNPGPGANPGVNPGANPRGATTRPRLDVPFKALYAVFDGSVAARKYDAVYPQSLTMTPDGKHCAYLARRGESEYAIIDGREVSTWKFESRSLELGAFRLSPNGAHWACPTRFGRVVVDGSEDRAIEVDRVFEHDPSYHYLSARLSNSPGAAAGDFLAFAGPGYRLHYVGVDGPGREWSRRMWVDRKPTLPVETGFVGNAPIAISRDRLHIACITKVPLTSTYVLTIDDQQRWRFEGIPASPPKFSPDGKHVALVFQDGPAIAEYTLSVDGVKWAAKVDHFTAVQFSADSKHVAAVGRDPDGTKHVLVDGKPGPGAADIRDIQLSPNGQHVIYRAGNDRGSVLAIDHKLMPEARAALFSPDGQHLAVVLGPPDTVHLVLDGQDQPAVYADIRDLIFSPDSQRLAFMAQTRQLASSGPPRDTYLLVVDGQPTPLSQFRGDTPASAPFFSPDSRHLVLIVHPQSTGGHRSVVVVDGQPAPRRFAYLAGPVFRTDGVLEYLGWDDPGGGTRYNPGHLYRITQGW